MGKKKKKKIYEIPSNEELQQIMQNNMLTEVIKQDLITLHKTQKSLKDLMMEALEAMKESIKILGVNDSDVEVIRTDIITTQVSDPEQYHDLADQVAINLMELGEMEEKPMIPDLRSVYGYKIFFHYTEGEEQTTLIFVWLLYYDINNEVHGYSMIVDSE